jgi:hypothetical protein
MLAARTTITSALLFFLLCAVLLASGPTAPAGNLLKNPGFERGGDELEPWVHATPISIATSKPRFTVTEDDPAEGKRSASLRVDYSGGYTCYSQSLRVPPKAKSVHLQGKVRLDRMTNYGGARLMLTFVGADVPGGQKSVSSRLLTGIADWTLLAIDASIPEGTKSIEVRCGVEGPCVASFDELVATASKEAAFEGSFGWVQSNYLVRWPANSTEELRVPFVRVPLPVAMDEQRPVAFRVNTRPEDKVSSVSVYRQGANRMLEVRMDSMFPGDEIKFRVEALVMVDARPVELPSLVRLPRPGQIKGDTNRYLGPAPGVDPEDPTVKRALIDIKGNDMPSILEACHSYVHSQLKLRVVDRDTEEPHIDPATDEVWDESVAACLKSGSAGTVGFANTLTSVLRGYGIPTRMMIGTRFDGTSDEHYLVDVWSPLLGWTRVDPMTGEWPLDRTTAIVHRLVEPEDPRPNGHTPYDPKVGSPGLVLELRPDRLDRGRLYRPSEPVTLMESGWNEVHARVVASYEDIAGEPLPGSVWLPIHGLEGEADEIPGAATAHLEIQRWLDSPRLVGQ